MVIRPYRRSGTGRETLPKVQNWSEDVPGVAEVVGRPSLTSGSGRETLPGVRNWSGHSPGRAELVEKIF